MISLPLLVLILCNFAAIGLLPILFFRRDGQYNLRWLATAAPFLAAPGTLLLGRFGLLDPYLTYGQAVLAASQTIAVALCAVSIALIAMTVGSHRIPLALWHQKNDAPVQLVTWGPYSRIRHPFYTSFILAFAAASIAFPHVLTIGCLVYCSAALSATARGEERRLSKSEFGSDYRNYMSVTGRFFPGIG